MPLNALRVDTSALRWLPGKMPANIPLMRLLVARTCSTSVSAPESVGTTTGWFWFRAQAKVPSSTRASISLVTLAQENSGSQTVNLKDASSSMPNMERLVNGISLLNWPKTALMTKAGSFCR